MNIVKLIFTFSVFACTQAQAQAQGFLSNFSLVAGSRDECPLGLKVTRSADNIFISTANSMDMNGLGPFSNSLIFSEINKGWLVSEISDAGTFSNKTELLMGSSVTRLISSEKLVKDSSSLRHTEIRFAVNNSAEAKLEFKIIALEKGIPAAAYSDIKCLYTEDN